MRNRYGELLKTPKSSPIHSTAPDYPRSSSQRTHQPIGFSCTLVKTYSNNHSRCTGKKKQGSSQCLYHSPVKMCASELTPERGVTDSAYSKPRRRTNLPQTLRLHTTSLRVRPLKCCRLLRRQYCVMHLCRGASLGSR